MDVDPGDRAKAYARGGADAVSVLCEPDFFKGSREDLREAASAVDIPVLCKDFVVDPYQLLQAAVDGARWVLLIARILGESLDGMVRKALSLGLEPLVEVHCEKEMRRAIASRARVIGINARDLDTFRVDLDVPARLAACCPAHCACIAESGIRTVDDLLFLRAAGAHGFLVGETLMRRGDPENAILSFKNALSPDARESEAV
jgi:indole-3-glycerol phosphate synthase